MNLIPTGFGTTKPVYFIRPIGMEGPVKIGCADIPAERLREFMSWSPFPLEIAVQIPGSYELEQNLHECFADKHSHREWFFANEKLSKLIVDLKAGHPIEMVIDLSARVGHIRKKQGRIYTESERLLLSYRARLKRVTDKANTINGAWKFRFMVPREIESLLNKWASMVTKVHGSPPPGAHVFDALENYIANPVFTEVKQPEQAKPVPAA